MKLFTLTALATGSLVAAQTLQPPLSALVTHHESKRVEFNIPVEGTMEWVTLFIENPKAQFCIPPLLTVAAAKYAGSEAEYIKHVWIGGGAATLGHWGAFFVCSQHYNKEEGYCKGLSAIVSGSVAFIYGTVVAATWQGGQAGTVTEDINAGTPATINTATMKRAELSGLIGDRLRASGHDLDHVEVVTKREVSEDVYPASNTTTLHVRGLRKAGSGDAPSDLEVSYDHVDGTGFVRSLDADRGAKEKRKAINGAWVKISFRVSKRIDPLPQFDDTYVQGMGYRIGEDWAWWMNQHHDHSRMYGMMQFGNSLGIQYVIIPENGWYDDGYEDVTACGAVEVRHV